jgi:hypothetical protein
VEFSELIDWSSYGVRSKQTLHRNKSISQWKFKIKFQVAIYKIKKRLKIWFTATPWWLYGWKSKQSIKRHWKIKKTWLTCRSNNFIRIRTRAPLKFLKSWIKGIPQFHIWQFQVKILTKKTHNSCKFQETL